MDNSNDLLQKKLITADIPAKTFHLGVIEKVLRKYSCLFIREKDNLKVFYNGYGYTFKENGPNKSFQKLYEQLKDFPSALVYGKQASQWEGIDTAISAYKQPERDEAIMQRLTFDTYLSEKINDVRKFINTHPHNLVIAPTGSGKTKLFVDIARASEKRTLFLLPYISMVSQFQKIFQHDTHKNLGVYSVFFDKMNREKITQALREKNNKIIFVTYDSFGKLLDYLIALGLNPYETFNIFLDEVHNFIWFTDIAKKDERLMKVLSEISRFEHVTAATGTASLFTYELLKTFTTDLKILKASHRHPKTKPVDILYSDTITDEGIQGYILDHLENREGQTVIRWDNLRRLVELSLYLEENNIPNILLSSVRKNSQIFQNIIRTEKFPDNIQVILTTSVINDGINITQGGNIERIFYIANLDSDKNIGKMEQFFSRFRDAENAHNICILRNDPYALSEYNTMAFPRKMEGFICDATSQLKALCEETERIANICSPSSRKNETAVSHVNAYLNNINNRSLFFDERKLKNPWNNRLNISECLFIKPVNAFNQYEKAFFTDLANIPEKYGEFLSVNTDTLRLSKTQFLPNIATFKLQLKSIRHPKIVLRTRYANHLLKTLKDTRRPVLEIIQKDKEFLLNSGEYRNEYFDYRKNRKKQTLLTLADIKLELKKLKTDDKKSISSYLEEKLSKDNPSKAKKQGIRHAFYTYLKDQLELSPFTAEEIIEKNLAYIRNSNSHPFMVRENHIEIALGEIERLEKKIRALLPFCHSEDVLHAVKVIAAQTRRKKNTRMNYKQLASIWLFEEIQKERNADYDYICEKYSRHPATQYFLKKSDIFVIVYLFRRRKKLTGEIDPAGFYETFKQDITQEHLAEKISLLFDPLVLYDLRAFQSEIDKTDFLISPEAKQLIITSAREKRKKETAQSLNHFLENTLAFDLQITQKQVTTLLNYLYRTKRTTTGKQNEPAKNIYRILSRNRVKRILTETLDTKETGEAHSTSPIAQPPVTLSPFQMEN